MAKFYICPFCGKISEFKNSIKDFPIIVPSINITIIISGVPCLKCLNCKQKIISIDCLYDITKISLTINFDLFLEKSPRKNNKACFATFKYKDIKDILLKP